MYTQNNFVISTPNYIYYYLGMYTLIKMWSMSTQIYKDVSPWSVFVQGKVHPHTSLNDNSMISSVAYLSGHWKVREREREREKGGGGETISITH